MIRRFLSNERGNVAIMTGAAFMAMALAAAGAVDYSHATSKRQTLQDAVDAAALHAVGLTGVDNAKRETAFGNMLAASDTCAEITCGSPAVSMTNGKLTAQVTAEVPTSILQIFAVDSVAIQAESTAIATGGPLKVVMVLDYSSSMDNSNKYQNMRTAAVAFMDKSIAHPRSEVAVGVAPFAEFVLTAMNGDYVVDVEGGTNLDGIDIVGCMTNRDYPHSVSSETPGAGVPASQWRALSFAMGSDASAGGFSDMPDSYSSTYASGYSAGDDCEEYADENLAVRPLSKNLAQTRTAIQSMRPTGGTNIALGLDVGWHMLTDNEPFTEATIDDPDAKKVIILLSDGSQTTAADGPHGHSIDSAESNIAETCEGMKAEGIEVFVIAFDISDSDVAEMLSDCATDEPFYFQPEVEDQLDLIFEGIYNTIASGDPRLAG